MAISLARMGSIPRNDTDYYGDAVRLDDQSKAALALRRKAAQDLQAGEIDLAQKALAQKELERTTREAEQGRGIRRDFIVNREGALDLPVGVRVSEFSQEQRPANAPFGPMGQPAPRNPMESRSIIDLARVNPDMADQFRTGQITERNAVEDRGRKIGAEDTKQIADFADDNFRRETKNRELTNAEKQQIIDNNQKWMALKIQGQNANTAATAAANKPVKTTVDQNNLANYGRRLMQAEQDFKTIEASGGDRTKAGASFKSRYFPNFAKPELLQQQEQAERNFLNAVLRRESGAVISPTEFSEGSKQYFPRFGDSKEVLEQKRRNRELVAESFKNLAGPAWNSAGGNVSGDPDYEEYLRLKAESGE